MIAHVKLFHSICHLSTLDMKMTPHIPLRLFPSFQHISISSLEILLARHFPRQAFAGDVGSSSRIPSFINSAGLGRCISFCSKLSARICFSNSLCCP